MLDIRAKAYISPLAEMPFASVPLTVRIANVADETGLIKGLFRVYNDSTGMLIFSSLIAPVSVAAGATVDVSALTNFDPPAPADDTYFVLFDGIAGNDLVPDGIDINLGSFYFDIKPAPLGPIPAGHAVTHEDTGIDEVDVNGLAGLLADPQTPILHHLDHETGGSDEVNVTDLAGLLADAQTPILHHLEHESGGSDEVDHAALINLTTGDPHTQYQLESAQLTSIITSATPQTLTDQAAIDWDLALGGAAKVTLGGDRTLNEASNKVNGACYSLRIIQDGTGTRLLTWHATYRFPGGVHPALSAAINTVDVILFISDGTYMDCVGMTSALS